MQYVTQINDESVYGITAAREAYNASLPQEVVITPATETEPEVRGPNPNLLTNDSAYLDFVLTHAIASWCKQYAPVVVPDVPPTVVNGVPQKVARTQAKKALALAGLLTTVESIIAGMTGQAGDFARIDWNDSLTFNRDNATLNQLGTQLGLTSEQLDQLFITAAGL